MGAGVLGPTTVEIGAQHLMLASPPPESPWLQIDLGRRRSFDSIALVPAILRFDSPGAETYGFPLRFRVDASDRADFTSFTPLYDSGDRPQEAFEAGPLVIPTAGAEARFIRVTVTQMAEVTERWTYALAEVFVLSGNRNIALNATVSMRGAIKLKPVWSADYLVDGRTPLGQPIAGRSPEARLPRYDGAFAGFDFKTKQNWITVDLEAPQAVQEVRLYPVHARQGADYPGYAFPKRFRVEAALEEDFAEKTVVYSTDGVDFSNPGSNPVTFVAKDEGGVQARYLRIVCLESSVKADQRFGLSEVQVYVGGRNVAINKPVRMSRVLVDRPPQLLVDGDASYGKILELPDWLKAWSTRIELKRELEESAKEVATAEGEAMQRVQAAAVSTFVLGLALAAVTVSTRRRRIRREQTAFREQLARDLHDEVGSNLAAIARIGEVAELEADGEQQHADWQSVRELAAECTDSMRDALWLLSAPGHAAEPFFRRLEAVARRMLTGVELRWSVATAEALDIVDDYARRELMLACKEVLANIAKHSRASAVEITVSRVDADYVLSFLDNGVGFQEGEADATQTGLGILSIERRLTSVHGKALFEAPESGGARVTFTLPASLLAPI